MKSVCRSLTAVIFGLTHFSSAVAVAPTDTPAPPLPFIHLDFARPAEGLGVDRSGNRHDFELLKDVEHSVQGGSSGALDLNGRTSLLGNDNPEALPAVKFAFAAWIKPTTVGWTRVIYSRDADIFFLQDGKLAIQKGGTWETVLSDANIEAEAWTHVAFSYENDAPGGLLLSVDGMVTRSQASFPAWRASGVQYIGAQASEKGRHFKGLIDDVQIFNRALSASELKAIYASSAPKMKPSGLQSDYSSEYFKIVSRDGRMAFKIGGCLWRPEITPALIGKVGGRRMYVHPGSYSFLCRVAGGNDNLLLGDVMPAFEDSQQVVLPARIKGVDRTGTLLPSEQTHGIRAGTGAEIWNFSYDGAFGCAMEGGTLFLVRHNEHQNVKESPGAPAYQGSIVPGRKVGVDGQHAGYWGGKVGDGWINDWDNGGSYGSFVSLSVVRLGPQDGRTLSYIDYGPVNWPSLGFLAAAADPNQASVKRPSTGHQLPTLFYPTAMFDPDRQPHIYCYFVNGCDSPGAGQAISVCRARVDGEANYQPSAWRNYHKGKWEEPSVPADMREASMKQYYVAGPGRPHQAEPVIYEPGWYSTWFTVAAVLEQGAFRGLYVGAEERCGKGSEGRDLAEVGLRFSRDLIHWSSLQVIDRSEAGWGHNRYTYPRFVDADCSSNHVVDGEDFWLIGLRPVDGGASSLYRMRLSLTQRRWQGTGRGG